MAKVRVTGWSTECNEEYLRVLCKVFGDITQIVNYKKSALVNFIELACARKAIAVLQGRKLVDGSVLKLELYYRTSCRICIKKDASREEIERAARSYGKIYNFEEGQTEYFVDFYNPRDADSAVQHGLKVSEGRVLSIRRPGSMHVNSSQTIFIYNIAPGTNEDDILNEFRRFGEIVSCGVQNSRGYVNYMQSHSAQRALKLLNGKKLKGKRILIKIKSAPS